MQFQQDSTVPTWAYRSPDPYSDFTGQNIRHRDSRARRQSQSRKIERDLCIDHDGSSEIADTWMTVKLHLIGVSCPNFAPVSNGDSRTIHFQIANSDHRKANSRIAFTSLMTEVEISSQHLETAVFAVERVAQQFRPGWVAVIRQTVWRTLVSGTQTREHYA